MKRKIISLILAIATVISLIPTNIFVFSTDDAASAEYGDVLASFGVVATSAKLYPSTSLDAQPLREIDITAIGHDGVFRIVEYYETPDEEKFENIGTLNTIEAVYRYRIHSDDLPAEYAGYAWVNAVDLTNIHQDDILEDTTLRGKQIHIVGHYDENGLLVEKFHKNPIGYLHDSTQEKLFDWYEEDKFAIFTIGDVYKTPWGTWYYVTIEDEIYAECNGEWVNATDTVFVEEDEEILIEGQVGIVKNGEVITEVLLPQRNHVEITAVKGDAISENATYQWQILIDAENERWADIKFYNKATATLSYALVVNVMDETSRSYVRCIITDGENRYVSDVLDVTLAYAAGSKAEYKSTSEVDTIALDTVATETQETYVLEVRFLFDKNSYESRKDKEAFQPITQPIGKEEAFTYTGEVMQLPGYTTYVPNLDMQGRYIDVNGNIIDEETEYKSNVIYRNKAGEYHDVNGKIITDTSAYAGQLFYIEGNTFTIRITKVTAAKCYDVLYRPNEVKYTVIHYQQNPNDDKYTEVLKEENHKGLTDFIVPDGLHKAATTEGFKGFHYIAYKKQHISGDGNTIIQIYYDREYYTIDFHLGEGGYGVNPISLRFGAEYKIPDIEKVVRPGYKLDKPISFTLTAAKTKDGTSVSNDILNRLQTDYNINDKNAITMPQYNLTYTANWTEATATYTYIYWKENADDDNFTIWGTTQSTAPTGSRVSATDNIPTDITTFIPDPTNPNKKIDERNYFTYSDALSEHNVVVKGDGTTAVNVYYLRNTYYLIFKASGVCAQEEHTHCMANCTQNHEHCNEVCALEVHIHSEACGNKKQICGLENHRHSEACDLTCTLGLNEHIVHKDDCLICDFETTHIHNSKCEFVGDLNTWRGNYTKPDNAPSNPKFGQIHSVWSIFGGTSYYVFVNDNEGGRWYKYEGTLTSGIESWETCHTHSETAGCYSDGDVIHIHTDACCSISAHQHNADCYTYEGCTQTAHTHDGSCFRGCTKLEHKHTATTCQNSNSTNTVKVVTAKYDARVIQHFEGGVQPDNGGDRYSPNARWESSATNKYYSILLKMPAGDSKNKTDYITLTYEAPYGSYTYTWYYALEKLNGITPPGKEDAPNDNNYFIDFSGSTSSNGSLSLTYEEEYFPITGFDQKNTTVPGFTNRKAYLYYTRNSYNIEFHDGVNKLNDRKQSFKYEADISSAYFVPDTPEGKEPGSVKFVGWYTTEACADGTEFVFDGATMPAHHVTLYAKWEPVYFNVTVYANSNDVNANKPLPSTDNWVNPQRVAFGTHAEAPLQLPTNGDYVFLGWFYQDVDGEQSFVFATSQVRSDLHIYAKWEYRVYVDYEVTYRFQNSKGEFVEIAKRTTGEEFVGTTDTLLAKAGKQLDATYQKGYFPTVTSKAVTFISDSQNPDANKWNFDYVHREKELYRVDHCILYADGNKEYIKGQPQETDSAWVVKDIHFGIEKQKEKFADLTPDAYTKELIVKATDNSTTVDEEANVITFYWTETDQFLYQVEFYLEDLNGAYVLADTFTSSFSKNQTIERTIRLYDGFNRIESKPLEFESYSKSTTCELSGDGTKFFLKLCGNTLIKIYYDRNSYTYMINYLYQDANGSTIKLRQSQEKEAKFGEIKTLEPAEDIDPGYTIDKNLKNTLEITSDPNQNVVNFYYQEEFVQLNYFVYSVLEQDYVATFSENISAVSGKPNGYDPSKAVNMLQYKFIGWYADKAMNNQITTNVTIVPTPTTATHQVSGKSYTYYQTVEYYGKFTPAFAALMITNNGIESFDPDQAVIFDIVGKGVGIERNIDVNMTVTIIGNSNVTITHLPVGSYKVTPRTDWSWRYSVTPETPHQEGSTTVIVELKNPNNPAEAVFNSTFAKSQWLSDNDYAEK